jgi:Mitochondrial carrier protein
MPRALPPIDAAASPELSPSLVETVAGFTAGAVATLVVHPFDVLKTRLQSKAGLVDGLMSLIFAQSTSRELNSASHTEF